MSTKLKLKSIELMVKECITQQSSISMNDFFELLLSSLLSSLKFNKESTDNGDALQDSSINNDSLACLLYAYFFYFKGFISSIQSIHPQKYKDLLFKIAELIKYEASESNRLLMHYGDKGDKFYFILKGKVDVILLNEKQVSITKLDYLRYLAYLIGYKEYEILNRVINSNMEHYPLYITDLIGNYKYNRINLAISPQYIELKDLYEVLTKEEKEKLKASFEVNFIEPMANKEEKDLVTLNYIDRLRQFDSKDKELNTKWDSETKIDFTIFEYYFVTTLSAGQMFGDFALSDVSNKRNATVITSDRCHFGVLSKANYELVLKEINDRIRKDNIAYILSSYIFKGISSSSLIQKQYLNYFVTHNISKGYKVLRQNASSINEILFLRKGFYEISAILSYEKLLAMINHLYSILLQPQYKREDKNCDLGYQINKMNAFSKRIVNRAKEVKSLNDFYRLNEAYVISSLNAPDIIGFKDFYSNNETTILYTFELKSQEGELLSINKEIYTQMCNQETVICLQEAKYVIMKIKKMLRRLLFLQTSKLEIYFRHNPDYFYFQEFALKRKIDIMKDILNIDLTPKENQPKFKFSCMSTKSIRNIQKDNNSISSSIEVNKEKQKTLQTSNILLYTNQSKHKPLINKSGANRRISTGNWTITRNKKYHQTISISNPNSNSITLLKGKFANNANNGKETITNQILRSLNQSTRKAMLPNTSKPIRLKKEYTLANKSKTNSPDKEDKETQVMQPLPCLTFDCSLSPLKKPSVSIIENLIFKKERYIDKRQLDNLKQTRIQVVRFQPQYSIGKKRINTNTNSNSNSNSIKSKAT